MNWVLIGLVALTAALVVLWRHHWRAGRVVVLLMFVGGLALVQAGGWLGQQLHRGGAALGSLVESGTAQLVGVGLPALVVVAAAVWVGVDLRDRVIHPATPWLALALPTLAVTVAGVASGSDLLATVGLA